MTRAAARTCPLVVAPSTRAGPEAHEDPIAVSIEARPGVIAARILSELKA